MQGSKPVAADAIASGQTQGQTDYGMGGGAMLGFGPVASAPSGASTTSATPPPPTEYTLAGAVTAAAPNSAVAVAVTERAVIAVTLPAPNAAVSLTSVPYVVAVVVTTNAPVAALQSRHGVSVAASASTGKPTVAANFALVPTMAVAATTPAPTVNAILAKEETYYLPFGSTSWTVPSGVTNISKVRLWGAGGGGNVAGGGGGAYTEVSNVAVTPGSQIAIQIGAGGEGVQDIFNGGTSNTTGVDGGNTWFQSSSYLQAGGGKGAFKTNLGGTINIGPAGQATGTATGRIGYNGRPGAAMGSGGEGGGGGSAAGPNGQGTVASGTTGGSGNGGGAGGVSSTNNGAGNDSIVAGGGGGGWAAIVSTAPGSMFPNYSRGGTVGAGGGGSHRDQPRYNEGTLTQHSSAKGCGGRGGDGQIALVYFAVPTTATFTVTTPLPTAILQALQGVNYSAAATAPLPVAAVLTNHVAHPASANVTLPAPTASAAVAHGVNAAFNVTTAAPAALFSGNLVVVSSVAATIPNPTVAVNLVRTVSGSAAVTLPAPSVTTLIGHGVSASASHTLPLPTAAVDATHSERRTSFSGALGEVVVVNRALTQTEQEKMDGYLAWRWHTQASLHPNHPYRWEPPTFAEPKRYTTVETILAKPTAAATIFRHQAIVVRPLAPVVELQAVAGTAYTGLARTNEPVVVTVMGHGVATSYAASTPKVLVSAEASHSVGLQGVVSASQPNVAQNVFHGYNPVVSASTVKPNVYGDWAFVGMRGGTVSATAPKPTVQLLSTHLFPRVGTTAITLPAPVAALRIGDPFWNQTELFLRGQTKVANSYEHIDSSRFPKTISGDTITLNVLDSPYGEAGGRSIRAPDFNDDGLRFSGSSRFNVGSGDFTIDLWMKPITNYYATPGASKNEQQLFFDNGAFQFGMDMSGNVFTSATGVIPNSSVWTFNGSNGVWKHVAVSRSSGTLRVFVSGTQVASTPYTTALHLSGSDDGNGYLFMDTGGQKTLEYTYMDDIRITTAARYTSSFALSLISPPAH